MSQVCEEVASLIRDKIRSGEWQAGFKLPVRTELISLLNSNNYTIQNAIKQLEEEGYLTVGARKSGTRVSESPPHSSSYYLIFPEEVNHWGYFWKALAEEAQKKSDTSCQIKCVHRINHLNSINDVQKMIANVQNKSVAGLIFTSSADEFINTPLLDTPGIPRVAISYPNRLPGIPKIKLGLEDFIDQAVAHLVAQGRKKLAILSPDTNIANRFIKASKTHRLQVNNAWIQFPRLGLKESSRNTVEMILSPIHTHRPDGLIIADDNLIEGAVEWLSNSKLSFPDDLSIVTLNNFPHTVPCNIPTTRFGFNIPSLLEMLISRLQDVSKGKKIVENTTLTAVQEIDFKTQDSNKNL